MESIFHIDFSNSMTARTGGEHLQEKEKNGLYSSRAYNTLLIAIIFFFVKFIPQILISFQRYIPISETINHCSFAEPPNLSKFHSNSHPSLLSHSSLFYRSLQIKSNQTLYFLELSFIVYSYTSYISSAIVMQFLSYCQKVLTISELISVSSSNLDHLQLVGIKLIRSYHWHSGGLRHFAPAVNDFLNIKQSTGRSNLL